MLSINSRVKTIPFELSIQIILFFEILFNSNAKPRRISQRNLLNLITYKIGHDVKEKFVEEIYIISRVFKILELLFPIYAIDHEQSN